VAARLMSVGGAVGLYLHKTVLPTLEMLVADSSRWYYDLNPKYDYNFFNELHSCPCLCVRSGR